MDSFSLVRKVANDLSAGIVVFPTAFDTTLKLRRLLGSESTSVGDIAAVVAREPLLASKLIQAANSAVLNPSGSRIESIPAAVTRIGSEGVRVIALGVAMQQLRQSKPMLRYDTLTAEIMAHSQRIGAIAGVTARACTGLGKDTAYFAGLVHDIGAFYLIYRIATEPGLAFADGELDVMLHDWHDHIGHALLGALRVPEAILDAVFEHDDPRPVPAVRSLRDLLYCAHAIEPTLPDFPPPSRWRPAIPDLAALPACATLAAAAETHAAEIAATVAANA